MTKLSPLEEWILVAVWQLGPGAYGVSVRSYLQERAGIRLSLGGVYGSLDRLTEQKLLQDHLGDPTPARGGRRKRYFRLTPAGRSALAAARRRERKIWGTASLPGLREGSR